MPVPFQNSYDFVNIKRDLSDSFTQIIQQNPVFSALVGSTETATSTKHEWLEDVVAPKQTDITGAYTAGDGLVTVASSDGFKVGDIIEFEKDTGAMSTLIGLVTVIAPTQIDFTIYNGTTDENLAINSIVHLQSRPKNEKTLADPDNGYEPTVEFNYTQIFDRTACLSLTNINVEKYGIGGGLNYEVERQLKDVSYDVVKSMLRGQRVQRTGANAGTMGGLNYFLQAATGNKVDALGAALSEGILNDAMEVVLNNGGDVTTILAHPIQARKISAFVANYRRVNIEQNAGTAIAGTFVQQYMSDQGQLLNIVYERNYDKDKVAVIDPSKVAFVALQNRSFEDKDATTPGADFVARRIIGEYTMKVMNAAESHVLITNLAI